MMREHVLMHLLDPLLVKDLSVLHYVQRDHLHQAPVKQFVQNVQLEHLHQSPEQHLVRLSFQINYFDRTTIPHTFKIYRKLKCPFPFIKFEIEMLCSVKTSHEFTYFKIRKRLSNKQTHVITLVISRFE